MADNTANHKLEADEDVGDHISSIFGFGAVAIDPGRIVKQGQSDVETHVQPIIPHLFAWGI